LVGHATHNVVQQIFHFIYGEGRNLEDEASVIELSTALGIPEAYKRISEPSIKKQLRDNTDEAIASGVFGVPTFIVERQLFWGDDATDMLRSFLHDPTLFEDDGMKRISSLPFGLERLLWLSETQSVWPFGSNWLMLTADG
jgi:predicted DsbA family dithiol-disulfide isomerase